MSTNQQKESSKSNNEEEVDLGSLFVIIGKGFSNFFNFIGAIFKGIFHFLITILIFLRENILKIGIAGFIGLIAGFFLEVKTPKKFESEMLLKPNFESTRQLYNNVNYYNDLVKQKDTVSLQKIFNLDKKTAASLEEFEIEPIITNRDIINAYDNLIESVDTLTIKSYVYEAFENSFTIYDYEVHKLNVTAKENDVFNKLGDVIISSVVNNNYFKRLKKLTNENLNRTDSLYRQNLTQIDSLRKVYMEVMIEEAKKTTAGTNIDLGGKNKTTKELELFTTNKVINQDLKNIASQKATEYEVINVLSSFQPIGTEIKGVTKNYAFLLAILGVGFMILVLLLRQLNAYLENYNK
ncbi:hypothetical protein N9764_05050 [Polaribacter sp.]|nr:hypothetical protein [Polaribacter sp.]MDB4204905.1 hypothetical protein [Polaribacter sp.]